VFVLTFKAQSVLASLREIAKLAYTESLKPVPPIPRDGYARLAKYWDKVEVFNINKSIPESTLLRLTKNNLMMTYKSENSGRVHKTLDGSVCDMGKWIVDINMSRTRTIGNIHVWSLMYKLYGQHKVARLTLLHPHIQKGFELEGTDMFCGNCCLGSYADALNTYCQSYDIMNLVDLLKDYLTSCSEGGWYNPFMPWMPEDVQRKYCKCGRQRWASPNVGSCPNCGQNPPSPEATT
jgi:hypothetical protein